MKVSLPTGGPLPQMWRSLPASSAAMLALALSAFTLTAQAQTALVPATKNTHLRKIGRHYDKLNYEAAIELLPKAVASAGKKEKELLWLDLMSGVLHYSLKDTAASEAAFKRAFERAPDTSLPIKDPSQTLTQRFEELRKAHAQEVQARQLSLSQASQASPKPISKMGLLGLLRELEAQAGKWVKGPMPPPLAAAFRSIYDQALKAQTPEERSAIAFAIRTWINLFNAGDMKALNELAIETVPGKDPAPGPATRSPDTASMTTLEQLRKAISLEVLLERVQRMREWLVVNSETGSTSQGRALLSQLNEHLGAVEASQTAHERMLIAISLDVFEVQMATHTGWRIQGSTPKAIALEGE